MSEGSRFILAVASLVALGGVASAADVASPKTDLWTGFYVGLHAGAGSGGFTNLDKDSANCWFCEKDYSGDLRGIMGGGTVGYNFTMGSFVVGAEAELGLTGLSGSETDFDDSEYVVKTSVSMDYYGTIAGRAGYAFGNALLYAKAGWGFMNTDFDWRDTYYIADASGSGMMSGLVFGGGIEYAVTEHTSVKIEYLRFQMGQSEVMPVVDDDYEGYEQTVEIDPINTLKIGWNYRF